VVQVRLVGENIEPGVLKTSEALLYQFELDLVEISPNADPPVCKIMDYKKFVYEQKKRDKILKAKSTQVIVKEIVLDLKQMSMIMNSREKNAEKFLKEVLN
jgi:translation initiation factor IF-3